MAVPDPLEHSGLGVTDGVKPGVVPPEPLERWLPKMRGMCRLLVWPSWTG